MKEKTKNKTKYLVAITMGSDSDFPKVKEAIKLLKEFSIKNKVEVVSAHRSPEKIKTFACQAKKDGAKVIIAAAGGAAHLPGMLAAYTTIPVIGIPVASQAP